MNQRLEIFTLGGLKIRRGGVPVTDFHSRKVEALLVYLACSHRPIPRDLLADLLWDHLPQERAMANLRVVLHSLRQQLDPYVTITHDEVGLDPQADVWLDVAAFEARLDAGQPEAALDLYHGDFLEGFFLRGAPRFEDWTAAEREHLYQRAVDELGQLVASSLATGQYQEGMPHARRLLALAPYLEEAHRQLMLLLAYSRRPRAALAQYQNCRQVLKEELGVAPAPQTTALYQQIRAGQLQLPSLPNRGSKQVPRKLQLPAFLTSLDDGPQEQPPLFVARERELAQLEGFLEAALRGQGRVVFVTGGPGRGKTALMKAFAQRAMAAHPQLLVASGACNAYAGVGDPYLPFREVLATITGDIESQWRAGTITRDHARRLWHALPVTIRALLDNGPHVVPALVPGEGLLSRCFAAVPSDTPWLRQLSERAMRWQIGSEDLKQSDLFQQVTHVLRQLALSHPLLFTLDDLQWADLASIGLLFHLGLRIESSRILIVGAYRPEELALGPRVRHPLEKTLSEFRRRFGDVWVDLAQVQESESQAFVNAFVDTEPNHLGEGFRRALFQHTGGHALFTIELLRTMQARGDVVQDEAGNWVEGPALDWKMLPPKVEGVIAERLARLDNELRSILDVASVEGEAFMAQVVARVQKLGERQALQALSHELEKRHRLVREQEALRAGGQQLSRYRFSHALFQQYLYHGLSEGERALLHGAVAAAMEALYAAAGRTQQVAVQLAHHYSEAGDDERALAHLTVAGDGALEGYANQEAESHYRAALELVHSDTQRAHLLSGLGRALDRQGRFQEAIESWRAGIELYQAVRDSDGVARLYAHSARAAGAAGDPPELLRLCQEGLAAVSGAPACPGVARLLHETARAHIQNALLEQSRSLCQQALTMAEQLGAFEVQVEALATLGGFLLSGERAVEVLTRAIELAESNGLVQAAARAHNNLGCQMENVLGRCRAARDHFRRSAEQGRQAGSNMDQLGPLSNAVETSAMLGEFETAEANLSRMRALVEEAAERDRTAWVVKSEMLLLAFRGHWVKVAALARAARIDAQERRAFVDLATANRRLAWGVLESHRFRPDDTVGPLAEAESALVEAIDIYDRWRQIFFSVDARVMLGNLCILKGQLGDARSVLDETQKSSDACPHAWGEPRLLALRAQLAAAEGHRAEALDAFQAASEHYARLEAPWYWARTLLDCADVHATGGEPRDLERACALLRDAHEAFEHISVARYAAIARQRLTQLESALSA